MLKPILHGIGGYVAGGIIGPAKWPHYDLIVVQEGSVDFTLRSRVISCRKGDALLIPPQTEFRARAGSEGCVIWVQHFTTARPPLAVPVSLPSRPRRWSFTQGEWLRELMKRISAGQSTANGNVSPAMVPLMLSLLLQELQLKPKPVSEDAGSIAVRKTATWLKAQTFPLPSLKEIADYAGWSTSHLRNSFRASTGRSIGTLLRELQMDEASRLLQETALPIKAISARVGYSDVVAFHRAFRRHKAMTPANFRRQMTPVI